MGYTHQWQRQQTLPLPQFIAAVADCRRICDALAIPLGDGHGEGQPVFTNTEICFNGHIQSGSLSSFQTASGLIWPDNKAHGIATIGQPEAVSGSWGHGPSVRGRVLGPDGDGSYETFVVPRVFESRHPSQELTPGLWFAFCKTNYRPYDLCVQVCLLILNHHLGSAMFRVSSDGKSEQWNDARDACQHVLGYGMAWGEGKLAVVPTEPSP